MYWHSHNLSLLRLFEILLLTIRWITTQKHQTCALFMGTLISFCIKNMMSHLEGRLSFQFCFQQKSLMNIHQQQSKPTPELEWLQLALGVLSIHRQSTKTISFVEGCIQTGTNGKLMRSMKIMSKRLISSNLRMVQDSLMIMSICWVWLDWFDLFYRYEKTWLRQLIILSILKKTRIKQLFNLPHSKGFKCRFLTKFLFREEMYLMH